MVLLDFAVKVVLTAVLSLFGNDDGAARRTADRALSKYPLIDLHVDIPIVLRAFYRGDVSHTDYFGPLRGHVDLDRLKKGRSGGLFSIAYTECPESPRGGTDEKQANALLLAPNDAVRDTLEQIDVTHQLVAQYGDQIGLALRSDDIRSLHRQKRIAHLIGVEGAHSLGNSLAVLRTFHALGVRYLTLTHVCHNAFADTAGWTDGRAEEPLHGGLSALGRRLIVEMNRIGMIVDVSHTSDDTARQAILHSRAPVIFSHSGAREIHRHPRNVPDDVLSLIAEGSGRDGIVGIPVLPQFIGSKPSLEQVADHAEHVARIAGKSRVAIGTDFDGFSRPIEGLEDVTHYVDLLAELARRGWTESELADVMSGNFLRIFRAVEKVAQDSKADRADTVAWQARRDLDPPQEE